MSLYVDNDGVLCSFDGHVETLFGQTPSQMGDNLLWQSVNSVSNFWLEAPVMDGALEFWEKIKHLNPTVLTGCPKTNYDHAAMCKPIWVKKHFGENTPVITCLSRDKGTFVKNSGDILIDDFMSNIKRWRKAGGVGIWFRNHTQALEELEALLNPFGK